MTASVSRGSDDSLTAEHARGILENLAEFGTPPLEGSGYFSVGFDPIFQALRERYLDGLLQKGKSCLKIVEARYGGGKTHFLYGIRDMARSSGFAVSLVDLGPQECNYSKPLLIYRAVAASLESPAGEGRSVRGLDHVLAARLEEQRAQAGTAEVEAWLRTTVRTIPADSTSFRAAVFAYLKALLDGEPASAEVLAAYLRGEPVNMGDLQHFGVHERMGNANAFRMLRSLCQVVRELGFAGVVLLMDEVDRLLTSRRVTRQAEAFLDNLRDLVDLVGRHELPGAMFLFAVPKTEFWEMVQHYQALAERLRSPFPAGPANPLAPVIDLERLSLDEGELLAAVGERLCDLAGCAGGQSVSPVVRANTAALANLCAGRATERGNRRLFVKSAALFLSGAAGDPTVPLVPEGLQRLIATG